MRTIFVSGVSRGLGRAIFECLIEHAAQPVGIGRKFTNYHFTSARNDQCTLVQCDLNAINQLVALDLSIGILSDTTELVFINNAGVIEPIAQIGHLNELDLSASITTNIMAPILLTNKLVEISQQRGLRLKIVNITSGAASRPLVGWSVYCTGKAAVRFFFDCLRAEHPAIGISHIDPGVLDTDMQRSVRLSSDIEFPQRPHFDRLNQDGRLRDPWEIAREIIRNEALI